MVKIGPNWSKSFKNGQYGQKWSKRSKKGQDIQYSQNGRYGQKRSKRVKNQNGDTAQKLKW